MYTKSWYYHHKTSYTTNSVGTNIVIILDGMYRNLYEVDEHLQVKKYFLINIYYIKI